ncbi:outer membrane protein assembly factor BamB family protein [Futiania mangrovi]|uniref:PQQ-binding-like beta-propeller repeat protein n=1 Tax=Futiania mangrovi TaxID=2959716 RepID=A0A9J6PHS1_9PROT|nr:PQQ-binding-like beta-propeller repeat protein [Futiania mangrovii]MCP1335626.1 PQQ-binding-like beta-propeller repeat protein [Futiania mangrovii]
MSPRRLLRLYRPLALALVALPLAGCGAYESIFGGEDEARLEGTRIPVLGTGGGLVADPAVAGTAVRVPPPVAIYDWPQTGVTPGHAVGALAGPSSFDVRWSVNVGDGGGSDTPVLSQPVIVGERIFVKDGEAGVHALARASGSTIWSVDLTPEGERSDTGFGGGLAYDAGRLFVTMPFGFVAALDPQTGNELWRASLGVPMRGAPAAAGGRVYAVTHDNQLYALDQSSGTVLWSYRAIVEPAGLLKTGVPGLRDDLVVAPFGSGEIVGLRPANGAVLWGDTLARTGLVTPLAALSAVAGSPVVEGDRVYAISHGGRFVALDALTGRRIWTIDVAGTEMPWSAGDHLFAVTTEAQVIAVRKADGRIRWVSSLPAFEDPDDREDPIFWSGPVLAGGQLVLTGSDGRLVALSPLDGSIVREADAPASFLAPVVAGDTLYVLGRDGTLAAFR